LLALNWRGLPEQERLLDRAMTAVAILIIPLAVIVHSVLSWAFAMTGRPGWDSTIFAPYFVVAALFSGIGMVILVVAGFRRAYRLHPIITLVQFRYLAYLMATLGALYLYFTFSELFTEGYIGSESTLPLVTALLVGPYAPYFWLFVFAGGVIPMVLVAVPRTRSVPGIVVASALVVGSMWLKRMLIILPPATAPLIPQAEAGVWGAFHPTWVSVGVTIGAAAAIPLLLMLLFKFIPILAIHEMATIEAEFSRATPVHDGAAARPQGEGAAA
jgi:molybdopterin-containing oxidoreductase family membrane subunit